MDEISTNINKRILLIRHGKPMVLSSANAHKKIRAKELYTYLNEYMLSDIDTSYLPETSLFNGGIINFRKIETYTLKDFKSKFEMPNAQVAMTFAKDIVSRFSNYYARQGQPDFDFDSLTKKLSA